ncbi:hypothetical protein [Galactobacter caseinivorans]|uniref:Uncharacterized protein n=1 Tax=Galactobacter caseinivorans TaxID=2676123 RepID=A0A496PI01_9MICC|nr:hypothetical protein [Galactobacter caseinivorans]RKW70102.1 hypothetical protein DWQ67_09085 [Galactobacter caseinivorans]
MNATSPTQIPTYSASDAAVAAVSAAAAQAPVSTPASVSAPAPVPTHEHGWFTQSSHRTSQGVVVYVSCAECGASRVDLHPSPGLIGSSHALSHEVGGRA